MKNLFFPPSTVEVIDVETFNITTFSLKGKHKSTAIRIDLSDSDDDQNDDVRILTSNPPNTPFGKHKKISEIGESSNSNNNNTITPFICYICTETKTINDALCIHYCSHSYCTVCVVMYVESKFQENVVKIHCPQPECEVEVLELQCCRGILPKEVFDRLGDALCETMILENEKFYCPYQDCLAFKVNYGGELVKESECPNCRRLFYAQCKVSWHDGIECDDFQKLNKDEREKEDIMFMQLANNNKWMRCPKCRIFVEKSHGCMYLKCRCGHAFCYNCGVVSKNNFH
ncbi:PREDICTED: E3 ubiquitin-protein ligase RNF144A-like [Lupinus angustifolius]|uniref:E3 ubiquitin-protein ligase RNF144A-like n=1 Tax=Lupinus angustifolius TaxID=3871 RepID=UPI00092FCB0E|nr:PREDICTED: E3 ubiquitin-protein ligase RNF144A-like [Lupinus angustifolius]